MAKKTKLIVEKSSAAKTKKSTRTNARAVAQPSRSKKGRVGTVHQRAKTVSGPARSADVHRGNQTTSSIAKSKSAKPRSKKNGKAAPKLEALAKQVVMMAQRQQDPAIAIPTRSLRVWDFECYFRETLGDVQAA